MQIRSATNQDAAAVREILFEVLAEYALMAEHQGVDADLDDIEGNYMGRGGLFDVVQDEKSGGIVGMVGLFPREPGVAELRKMYLRKSHRGKGLGRKLLDRVLAEGRRRGFRRIELETSSKLVEAIALYQKYGFRPFTPKHLACRCDQAFFLDLTEFKRT